VRTYAVHQGLEAVPEVARRLGMRVKLGAWIGRDAEANAAEIERAVRLTREYRDVIDLLIVGNEVLLRRELPVERLAALLARARSESAVPVSYADVWEFWLRNDALRSQVDVVTVHILPYWEDEPVPVEHAVEHVFSIAGRVKAHFAGQPVLVGETGWPAAGRQRDGAIPGRVNQARFAREFVARAQREGLAYNLIEAFDQPWKRALEGAMGGYWGVFDREGNPRFPWKGPMAEDPDWWRAVAAAGVAAAAGLLLAWWRWRSVAAAVATALAWILVAASALAHWQYMLAWLVTPLQWTGGAAAALLALLCALLGAERLAVVTAAATTPGAAQALFGPALPRRALSLARLGMLFCAAVVALGLAFDPRYRGFPWALLVAPALVLVALRIAGERPDTDAREEWLLAIVIAACAPAIVWIEGVHNMQAMIFSALLLMMAGAAVWPDRNAERRAERASGERGN
jgi:glucan 1,3-beta-glucosidase